MKGRYDVLVVGGGPGGAVAAKTAAMAGLSVCLIEKRPAIGSPVRCAEGVGKEIHEFIDPDPLWIAAEIDQALVVGPHGASMRLSPESAGDKVGYVLERKIFDRALVRDAAEAGAEIAVKTQAVAPVIENGRVAGAMLDGGGRKILSDVTIAADGVESLFARMCGIDTSVPLKEMMSCAQYLVAGIDIEPSTNVFFVGRDVAPEGYLWIFPKGNRTANIGVGISGRKSKEGHRAKDYLDAFVRTRFPDGSNIEFITGGVPVSQPLESTVADGLMIVGDAARVVNPLTGGGIWNAMHTGRLAAQVASDCISRGNCSRTALAAYDRGWREAPFGKMLEQTYRLKEFFVTLPDDHLDQIVSSAARIPMAEFSTARLVRELALRNPRILANLPRFFR